jgi:hypothetical protein
LKPAAVPADEPLDAPVNSPLRSLRLNAKRGIVGGLVPPFGFAFETDRKILPNILS